jgi:endonuclease/exonuclease/phosphatase family metal-dependent hydrolase
MKLRFSDLSLLLLLSAACQSQLASGGGTQADRAVSPVETTAPVVIRVLTYNIRHGEGRDRVLDLTRTAEAMKKAQPDIVALQEVDRLTNRSGGVDQLAELARLMGMHAEFGRAMAYDDGEYGVGVLSRWPIQSVETNLLPSSEYYEQRTSLSVRVRAGEHGPDFLFTSAHLSTSREVGDALGQAKRLNELLVAGHGVPSILAGDFNAGSDSEVMRVFAAEWTIAAPPAPQPAPPTATTAARPSAPTSTTGGPTGPAGPGRGRGGGPRNDYVLLRPAGHWRVVETTLIDDAGASDHRPVLSIVEWVGPGIATATLSRGAPGTSTTRQRPSS